MELKSSGLFRIITLIAILVFGKEADAGRKFGQPLQGINQECNNEGQPFEVNHIDSRRCYSCKCKNGFVQCDIDCPRKDGCYLFEEKSKDGCCDICKGCMYKGIYHPSYTEWKDPTEPCKIFRCDASIITQTEVQCYTPCSNPIPPGRGECCPTCPECKIHGQIPSANRYVTTGDPCLTCHCNGGRMTCSKKACPVLNCPRDKIIQVPGECCPKCKETKHHFNPPKGCLTFVHDQVAKKEGEKFIFDKCTTCTCKNGTSVCHRKSCPILDCSLRFQKMSNDSCCRECDESYDTQASSTQCSYEDKYYEDGETWQMSECSTCRCQKGIPSCIMQNCNVKLPCPAGSHFVHQRGECCGKCMESEGVCMVFGDPHYKTFDGHMYTFRAEGKYQLISDCHRHTFSIRVTNAFQSKTKTSAITKRVSIKIADTRIILGQRLRTRVNGEKIGFPYTKPKVDIKKVGENVMVTLLNDVKILWNGKSFLEVTVPPKFKKKLCGLCGNFNSNAQDDLKMRKGPVVSESKIAKFATSWCVSKKCADFRVAQCPRKRKNFERKACEYLSNSDLFNACNTKLNYKKFYKACMMDMCDCPSGKCYCESLMAYAQECKRLGVDIDGWRDQTHCSGNDVRRPKIHVKNRKFSMENLWQQYRNRTRIPERGNFTIPLLENQY